MEMRFVFPLPPTLTNSARGRSRHWRALKREKDQYWQRLDLLLAARRLPQPPKKPIGRARARVRYFLWNLMDESGAMARLKWIEDWLVTRGYLVDDRRANLRYEALPDQVIDRKNPRVELYLISEDDESPSGE